MKKRFSLMRLLQITRVDAFTQKRQLDGNRIPTRRASVLCGDRQREIARESFVR
jgi:hypothetical protein